MAMRIHPPLPCWIEVNDPKTAIWGFVSVRMQHRHTSDKIRFAMRSIIESVRPTVATPTPSPILRRYEKIVTHGTSLDIKGVHSGGSFSGYLTLNDEIFGTTYNHCVVPNTNPSSSGRPHIRMQGKLNHLRRTTTIHFSLNSISKKKSFECP